MQNLWFFQSVSSLFGDDFMLHYYTHYVNRYRFSLHPKARYFFFSPCLFLPGNCAGVSSTKVTAVQYACRAYGRPAVAFLIFAHWTGRDTTAAGIMKLLFELLMA